MMTIVSPTRTRLTKTWKTKKRTRLTKTRKTTKRTRLAKTWKTSQRKVNRAGLKSSESKKCVRSKRARSFLKKNVNDREC